MKTMTKKTTDWLVMAAARIEGKAMMAAARTRQVLYDGDTKTINATWTAGDKVYVYNMGKEAAIGGYLEAKSAGETVTLEGDLTGTFAAGDLLVLAFPQFDQDYTHQDGTLATIASTCDTWGLPVVSDVTNGKITVDTGEDPSVQFMNMQAIVKFTLQLDDCWRLSRLRLPRPCGGRGIVSKSNIHI